MNLIVHQDWREKVYKAPKERLPEDWDALCVVVMERDHRKCTNCGTRQRKTNKLTVHHIIPRKKGGTDELSNLTTLCQRCHDLEELGLDYISNKPKPLVGADWHTWVYGGASNPLTLR